MSAQFKPMSLCEASAAVHAGAVIDRLPEPVEIDEVPYSFYLTMPNGDRYLITRQILKAIENSPVPVPERHLRAVPAIKSS